MGLDPRALLADADDPAAARFAREVASRASSRLSSVTSLHAPRGRAGGGRSPGDTHSPRRRAIGTWTESMPSSETPRRMNGTPSWRGPRRRRCRKTRRTRRSGVSAAHTAASPHRHSRPRPPTVPTRDGRPVPVTSPRSRMPNRARLRSRSLSSGLPVAAHAPRKTRLGRIATAVPPTPPDAPVTRTGPDAGSRLVPRARRPTSRPVKPASEIVMASRGDSPGARGTTQSAGTRSYSAYPPWRETPSSYPWTTTDHQPRLWDPGSRRPRLRDRCPV